MKMETKYYGLVDEQGRPVKLQPGVRAVCDMEWTPFLGQHPCIDIVGNS